VKVGRSYRREAKLSWEARTIVSVAMEKQSASCKKGLTIFERMHAEHEFSRFFVTLGTVNFAAGQLEEAEKAWTRALVVLGDSPETAGLRAITLCDLGGLKLRRGRRGKRSR
jgi:hypothetical protein